jgi:orotate phosphoribosyltransferase
VKNLVSKFAFSNSTCAATPRARAFAKKLCDAPMAIIDKRRTGHNKAEVMNLIGDVDGKVAIMLDDMIDTGGTLLAVGLCTLNQVDPYPITYSLSNP